jgi:dTDP-glucose 4,6-dehydratase
VIIKYLKRKNALQFLIKEVVENKDVELYNNGSAIRDYMYVDDVCDAIKHCIDNAPVNEIINIGNGKPYVLRDIILKTIEKTSSTSNIIDIKPSHFHDVVQVEHSYLDISKLQSYGFKNQYDIEHIIDNLIKFYKK